MYVIKTALGHVDEAICANTITASSGTLTCDLSAEESGRFEAKGYLSQSAARVSTSWVGNLYGEGIANIADATIFGSIIIIAFALLGASFGNVFIAAPLMIIGVSLTIYFGMLKFSELFITVFIGIMIIVIIIAARRIGTARQHG